ncbi:MAG: response regulator [Magnetococcales bacterium]|nr:response regulator [Magnetococcales bacterium]MBF0151454.1 response regulator [Magnetococcales bacterium]MBF0174411.1 response regulator [Magnetococcales bacterium]MBF0348432.1 response regulator [Magnetococcales bacterium]MBF0632468.1 response regulator [Magnetococcales bacterium]
MEKKKALIVDDSSLARMMVRKFFTEGFKDWDLLEAKDALEALEKAEGLPLQLALVDFNMPGMNGIDLAEKLLEKQPGLSIHLVTANIQERMQLRAESIGIGFIKKPISQEKISDAMQRLSG